MTKYRIIRLRDGEDPGTWKEYGMAEASSPERALRSFPDVLGGTYIAVPDRSWKPLTVALEKTTKVTIG